MISESLKRKFKNKVFSTIFYSNLFLICITIVIIFFNMTSSHSLNLLKSSGFYKHIKDSLPVSWTIPYEVKRTELATKSEVNLAFGKPYTFSEKPNYSYCTDNDDSTQLTDGEYTTGYFWTQRTTVGWCNVSPVIITIDLKKTEPIKGLSYSTAAGIAAAVSWPNGIFIMVSEDGKQFSYIGELTQLSSVNNLPDPKKYTIHRYITLRLTTKGRYVRLVIHPAGLYTFCDEIEVYRGENEWLNYPPGGESFVNLDKSLAMLSTDTGIRTRLRLDLNKIQKKLRNSSLLTAEKQKVEKELTALNSEIDLLLRNYNSEFRAVVPFNDLHRQIISINARLLRARGAPEFFIWHTNRYDMLDPIDEPEEIPHRPPMLEVHMMNGEYRAEVFNMTNASDETIFVQLRIEDFQVGVSPSWVTIHEVQFVDTQEKIVIADALPLAKRTETGFRIEVPSGMTRQVWFSFHPKGRLARSYNVTIILQPGIDKKEVCIPLALHIYPFRFPDQPTMSLGVWDYIDNNLYDITPENRLAAIDNMKNHFVDSPWASTSTYPRVSPSDFDAHGNLIKPMNFSKFDKWIKEWDGARNYLVYMDVGESFAGKVMGSSEFNRAVGQWANAWDKHNREIGLKPGQVGVLLVDEPHSDKHCQNVHTWAKAIKEGTDGITIWEDPTHDKPWILKVQEMFRICDVLCPNLPIYLRGGEKMISFYATLIEKGKKLWFYQCSGPSRLLDPYYYYRLHYWHCWIHGATGSGFWAYGVTAGCSPWNEYRGHHTSYSPVYLTENSITDGKHWEAVREGIEDYEYFHMLWNRLRELKKKGIASPKLTDAEKLLKELPKQVVGKFKAGDISWVTDKDRSSADRVRIQVLDSLLNLKYL